MSNGATPPTAIRCLTLLAEHHGLFEPAARLRRETSTAEPDDAALLALARGCGFEAGLHQRRWRSLPTLEERTPLVARLDNGNSVLIAGVVRTADSEHVAIFDPLAGDGFLDGRSALNRH